ncbi:hypothetical protein BKA64DRAFT_655105 [Cadophora sp. MPI-SDFR-AT-0126]|nr:hypothetical protein BKA64DRAFT_655105 [Leotiomycetes sp. MPI-SDFR-AT-0126]
MPLVSQALAFNQTFSNLDVVTSARAKLDQAVTAYHKPELTKSAKLFLESWRILRNEYESGLYKRLDYSLPVKEQMRQERSVARETKARMLLSLVALHDLARACSRINEEYKDKTGKCKLDVYALRYGWEGNTTTEVLEIEEDDEDNARSKPWPKGSGIAHVLPLKDPLGRLLEEANSFKEAAFIIANICSLQIASVSEPSKEYQDGCDFISDSLLWMRRRTSFEIASVKAADSNRFKQMQEKTKKDSEDDEDEKTRKKLVLKMNDWESKKKPLDKKDEEELSDLFDQLHAASLSEQLIRQLERFHVTDRAGLWRYKGDNFERIQEKNNDSDDEDDEDDEEERLLLRGG